jgi:predicted DNA-binding protein (MmcQ/YjbR family)
MDRDDLRELCLSFPGAVETFPFSAETSVFKVAGKMFALSALAAEPLSVSLKCDPGLSEQLRRAHAEITPGYHLNKKHWISVRITSGTLSAEMLGDLVEDSYDLVVAALPERQRRALRWRGEPAA